MFVSETEIGENTEIKRGFSASGSICTLIWSVGPNVAIMYKIRHQQIWN